MSLKGKNLCNIIHSIAAESIFSSNKNESRMHGKFTPTYGRHTKHYKSSVETRTGAFNQTIIILIYKQSVIFHDTFPSRVMQHASFTQYIQLVGSMKATSELQFVWKNQISVVLKAEISAQYLHYNKPIFS